MPRVPSWRLSRDTILFGLGLVGIGYETIATGGERPVLLVLFGGMCGLPVFLNKDESQSKAIAVAAEARQTAKSADAELLLRNLPPADVLDLVRTLIAERDKPPEPGQQRRHTDPEYIPPPTDGGLA